MERSSARYATIRGVDPELTSLDLYLPRAGPSGPLVLYAHGGGWKEGDRSKVGGIPDTLGENGFALASANYRLAPEAEFPAHVEDLASAVAWIHDNPPSSKRGEGLYLMGTSAGAHLVSLLATCPSYLNCHGLSPGILTGAIALDTRAFDIPHLMANLPRGGGRLYRDVFGDDPARWSAASPINYVDRKVAIPRFMIAYTLTDPLRRMESRRFAARLRQEGFLAQLVPLAKRKHARIVPGFGSKDDPVSEAVLAFLRA
jgi:acetyl esterase/lipase